MTDEEFIRMMRTQDEYIDSSFADVINHRLGNIKKDGVICQYVFMEGDCLEFVEEFLKENYPGLWQGYIGSSGH